ncbi:protein kinase [Actinoplanes sp. NPDC023714]|uniref:serine/threonine-protein kinase n=1 Tax=Actinoplanes sp. NPDC023714 TaxID=3154322 RepID=UPI0034054881
MGHQSGELIGGRYRLDDRIASGGMGEVWRATDTTLGRDVAVKTMHADRAADPQFQTRFRHEAQAMAALHHPGIADVYDYGQEPDQDAYLVMARVDGVPLDRRIGEQGRLSPAETLSIVSQAGRALQAVHGAGIVHRDVKPGNLIIQPDGAVVLVDFGISRSARSEARTAAGEVVGTANYIAPEQVSQSPVGPAADVYALGAVAYHCLAGHPPFLGGTAVAVALQHLRDQPPALPADVPPQVRDLVFTALAKDPQQRFASAAAMAAAADRLAGAAPAESATMLITPAATTVRASSAAPADQPAARGRPALIAVLAALLVLIGAGSVLAFADPFDWFPATPVPSTSVPSASVPAEPSATPPARPPQNGGAGGQTSRPATTTAPPSSPTPDGSSPVPVTSSPTPASSSPPPPASPSKEVSSEPPASSPSSTAPRAGA